MRQLLPEALGLGAHGRRGCAGPPPVCRCRDVRRPAEWGSQVDLVGGGHRPGPPVVVDLDAALVAVALPAEVRRRALEELRAPAFKLPDVDGDPSPARRVARV